jgi:hypothetical protein
MRTEQEKEQLSITLQRMRSGEFQPFVKLLEDRIRDRTDTLRNTSDPVVVYRMQGQIMALSDLLTTIGGNPNFS